MVVFVKHVNLTASWGELRALHAMNGVSYSAAMAFSASMKVAPLAILMLYLLIVSIATDDGAPHVEVRYEPQPGIIDWPVEAAESPLELETPSNLVPGR